jgi:RHS repeat-associated protein
MEAMAGGATTDLYYSAAWQVLEERIGGTPKAQYVWSPVYVDALVERDRDANGQTGDALEQRLYAQQDANYNITALVDASGNVVERYVEDPYGQVMVLTAAWADQGVSLFVWLYLHQGGRFEQLSATYGFRYRDLSSALGRWLQRDPIELAGGDTNFYRVLGNRPTILVDPKGLDSNCPPSGTRPSGAPTTGTRGIPSSGSFRGCCGAYQGCYGNPGLCVGTGRIPTTVALGTIGCPGTIPSVPPRGPGSSGGQASGTPSGHKPALAAAAPLALGVSAADGPLPIGDAIGLAILFDSAP